jgi:hypothetical protein
VSKTIEIYNKDKILPFKIGASGYDFEISQKSGPKNAGKLTHPGFKHLDGILSLHGYSVNRFAVTLVTSNADCVAVSVKLLHNSDANAYIHDPASIFRGIKLKTQNRACCDFRSCNKPCANGSAVQCSNVKWNIPVVNTGFKPCDFFDQGLDPFDSPPVTVRTEFPVELFMPPILTVTAPEPEH